MKLVTKYNNHNRNSNNNNKIDLCRGRVGGNDLPVVAVAVDVPLRICHLRLKLPLVACQGQLQTVFRIMDLRQLLPRDRDPNKL